MPVSQAENPSLPLELVRFFVSDFQHRLIMDDPNITMEKYIRLKEEKAQRQGQTFDWQTARKALFTSHAWRRLFEVTEPLVIEFMLEFFSTCRITDTKMGLDVADTLCSERMILDKGDLRYYWMEISSDRDFLGPAPSYVHIRDPLRRLYHRMIACSIFGRGQEAKKVTRVDLFNLRTMDRGTANVPYLLSKYLFRHAEGRKNGAWLSGGHFIGQLAAHFGLVGDQGLRGLSVVVSELLVIDLHELARLNICSRFGDTWAWVAPRPKR
ncbi:hypothetical protein Tco_1138767 [Tanacetum coccineum]